MPTPRKLEILRKAKGIAMERQVRAGLPAITPSEQELRETGVFQEAQIDLMQVDQEALSEQRRYLEDMAGDMRLKIIPEKGLTALRKETGFEWTNGWTKHERKPKAKKETRSDREIRKWLEMRGKYASGEFKGGIERFTTRVGKYKASIILGRDFQEGGEAYLRRKGMKKFWDYDFSTEKTPKPKPRQKIDRSTTKGLEKLPLIPKVKLPSTIIANRKKPIDRSTAKGLMKIVLKSKPKRTKIHVERSGKTMRKLRKVNGVKMFAFPDDVWKVRKPRRRKK